MDRSVGSTMDYLGESGGVFVREHYLKTAGDYFQSHCHTINHVTLVQKGSVRCDVDGHPPLTLTAPAWITIDKDTWHKFTALEDDTRYYCIFSSYDEAGNKEGTRADDPAKTLGVCVGCRTREDGLLG